MIKNQKIIILFLLLFTLHFTLFTSTVYADDSTPSASIASKLNELKNEIASRAAQLKAQIGANLQNKAFVGTISSKSDTTITLATNSGAKIININQDTNYLSWIKNSKFQAKTLVVGSFLAALGDIDDVGVLTAKKLILMATPKTKDKSYLWGQIVSVNNSSLVLTDKDSKTFNVSVDKKTDYKADAGESNFDNLKMGDFVAISGILDDKNNLQASLIFIYSKPGFIKKDLKTDLPASASTKVATNSTKLKRS